jgi:acyl-CoA ligase (AMP-forming) (exosortase A-associated)
MTYSEVDLSVSRLAFSLRSTGLNRGDRIGIFLEPSISQCLAIFAASRANAVFVPINHLLHAEQMAHIVSDCGIKALIVTRARLSELSPVLKKLSSLSFLVGVGDGEDRDSALPVYSFEEFCSGSQICQPDLTIGNDLAAILYTSGSTGRPKGAMLTHAQIMAGASIVSSYLEITEHDRILAVLPFSFDAGLNQLMTAFQQGGTLVVFQFTFAKEVVDALYRERITGLAGVPTLWALLAQPQSGLHKSSLAHLRYITNTGGAMPQTILTRLRSALPGTKIYLMYGLTEAFRSTYLPPEELDRRPTSIGKAIPNTEILVVNEHGAICKPGEVGELVHRGPTVFLGYWGRPDLTREVLRPLPSVLSAIGDGEKVCYSGDLVKSDNDGFLYYVGRRDTMIKSSGFRISPTEVEDTLFQSGEIREAAVIGLPDEILGQYLKAFVVARENAVRDATRLIAFCAERMPRYMLPKTVEYMDDLPKTTSGKVDYTALRKHEGL